MYLTSTDEVLTRSAHLVLEPYASYLEASVSYDESLSDVKSQLGLRVLYHITASPNRRNILRYHEPWLARDMPPQQVLDMISLLYAKIRHYVGALDTSYVVSTSPGILFHVPELTRLLKHYPLLSGGTSRPMWPNIAHNQVIYAMHLFDAGGRYPMVFDPDAARSLVIAAREQASLVEEHQSSEGDESNSRVTKCAACNEVKIARVLCPVCGSQSNSRRARRWSE